MINFLGYPKFLAWDDLGNPASGYKVWTYAAGTTTPTATYPTIADALALTNANTNPVVLDSRGEGLIVPLVSTKFVLTTGTATDISSPVWTVDNVYTPVDIYDTNGKLILKFTAATDAVNYLDIKNSATGVSLEIDALGTDTNIDIKVTPKGTGKLTTAAMMKAAGFQISDNSGIYDSNGNLVIDVAATSSAVNYMKMTNAATSGAPILEVIGSDTNINFVFGAKGAGVYLFRGSSTQAARLWISEDTDNGSDAVILTAPASLASSVLFQFPSTTGTSGYALTTDGSGITSWANLAPATTGLAKFWVTFSGSGVLTIFYSFNVASLTDLGTGLYKINFTTPFSHTLYSIAGMCSPDATSHIMTTNLAVDVLTTSVTINIITGSLVASDASYVSVVGYGAQ